MIATRNRVARHLDPPAPPADTRGRYELVSDAVLRAVAAVTRLLDDDDPAVVLKAAKMILDVEKTRMRHGREVHGAPDPYREETRQMLGPIWNNPNPVKPEHDDDFDDFDEDDDDLIPRPTFQGWRGGVHGDNSFVAPTSEPVLTSATPARRPVPREQERVEHPLSVPESGPAGEVLGTAEPSEFQRWLKGFYAERFGGVLANAPPWVPPPCGPDSHPLSSSVKLRPA